jgi:hypothetical protein
VPVDYKKKYEQLVDLIAKLEMQIVQPDVAGNHEYMCRGRLTPDEWALVYEIKGWKQATQGTVYPA